MSLTLDQEDARDRAERRRKGVRIVLLGLAGGAVGAGLGYFGDHLFDLDRIGWPDLLAGLVALTLIVGAFSGGVAILLRRPGVSSTCGWLQVAAMLLAGVLLLLPMAGLDPVVGMAAVAVLFAVQTAANVALWRAGDELLRRVIVETGAVSFWTLQAALFLYAAAERLALAPTVSAWGLTGVLMVAYVVASTIVAVRRGFS